MTGDECMGTYAQAEARLLEAWAAWKAEQGPAIATAKEHRARHARLHEATTRFVQAAAVLAWHIDHRAAIDTAMKEQKG